MKTKQNHFLPIAAIFLITALVGDLRAVDKPPIEYPYKPYMEGKMDPQITGWPLSEEGKAYVLKAPGERKPGMEVGGAAIAEMVPVTPAAGKWKDPNAWLYDEHGRCVQAVQDNKENIDILLVGDSITYFWSPSYKSGEKWVPKFGDAWKNRFGQYHTVNIGIKGDTTQTILWRLDHGAIDGAKPKVIVLLIGINNGPTPENHKTIGQGIKLCVANLRARCPESQIIVVKTLPKASEGVKRLGDYMDEMKLTNDPKLQVLDLWDDFVNPDGSADNNLYIDGDLHLSPAGFEIYAERLKPLIEKAMKP
jgi:lysophospholipase L1-like esterase